MEELIKDTLFTLGEIHSQGRWDRKEVKESHLLNFFKKFNCLFTLVWTRYIIISKVTVPTVHLFNVLRSPARKYVAESKKGEN